MKVSVVMPVYNGAKFVRDAVESILSQSYDNFELLVVDGGSSDETPKILAAIRDVRLTSIFTRLNLTNSLNTALRAAKGDLIIRMDADDIAKPNRLALQVEYYKRHPNIAMFGTSATVINADGGVIGNADMPREPWWAEWCLFFGCPFVHPTVAISKQFLIRNAIEYGKVPVSDNDVLRLPLLRECEDYLMWSVISRRGPMANLPQRTLKLRMHQTSKSSVNADSVRTATEEISRWNAACFLNEPIEKKEWCRGNSDFDATAHQARLKQLGELYITRRSLEFRRAMIIRQDYAFRAMLARPCEHGGVRLIRAFKILSETRFLIPPSKLKSAIKYTLGSSYLARIKALARTA
ncbi:MAG: glycosyltransferase family A protein [Armatimonadota bacterium]|nr:glycosyltransferase family A protein [Armatimonadota bacterium]